MRWDARKAVIVSSNCSDRMCLNVVWGVFVHCAIWFGGVSIVQSNSLSLW